MERELVYRAAQTAWNVECRLDTLVEVLTEAGEYGGFTLDWAKARHAEFQPIFEGLSEAAGILHAAISEMERE
jgi:hypothetical protein